MRTLLRRLAPAVALVALLAACGDDDVATTTTDATTRTTDDPGTTGSTGGTGPGGGQTAAVAAARALWDDAGIDTYVLVLERGCFCSDEYRGPFEVEVVDGRVAAVRDDDGRPVPADVADGLPTVDDLLDLAAEHADQPALVALELDPTDGHPVLVSVDPERDVADEEFSYTVSSLTEGAASPADDPVGDDPATDDAVAELAAAEARWAAEGSADYSVDVHVRCGECVGSSSEPVTVVVEGDVVVDTFWAEPTDSDVLPPSPEQLADYTVPALFAHIADALDAGHSIEVDYDAVDGHPTVVDDEGFVDTLDDEVRVDVLELRLR